MDKEGFLCIRVSDLDRLCTDWGKAHVGKVCKRFELIEDKEVLKGQVKELIYEDVRQLKTLIETYNSGLLQTIHTTEFKFIQGKDSAT